MFRREIREGGREYDNNNNNNFADYFLVTLKSFNGDEGICTQLKQLRFPFSSLEFFQSKNLYILAPLPEVLIAWRRNETYSGDARIGVGCRFWLWKCHGKIGVEDQVADAAHDSFFEPPPCHPDDIRRTTLKLNFNYILKYLKDLPTFQRFYKISKVFQRTQNISKGFKDLPKIRFPEW